MRVIITSALFFLTLSADGQILTPGAQDRYESRRDPYYRDDPYYERDRDREIRRERRRERRRDQRQGDYGYSGQGGYGGYGYSSNPLDIANRVASDVRMVASNNYAVDKDDRKHFEEVEEELGKFMRKYRDGKFDKNNLKDAAESLDHLARSSRIRSARDRRILSDSLAVVQDMRSGRYGTDARARNDGSIWDVFGGR